ncbi:MAG: hypothetical protein ACD_56C00119G0002 [uncultured bacterium]|nr:MAG: hypothetical protein ACD_56C00119G0002 [uncultured bacterium]
MKKQASKILFLFAIFVTLSNSTQADWQQELETNFDIVETFDNLQDWSANGLFPSSATDVRAYDPSLLPKKLDGSNSRWGYWANKYPTPIVETINNGPFQTGETVTNDLGATWEYRQTYVIDGVTYLRLKDAIFGQSVGTFQIGHTLRGLTSGATATITAWPQIIADHGTNKWGSSGKSLMMNLGDNDNSDGAMAGIGAQRLGMFFGDGITGKSGYKKIHIFMMVKFTPFFFGASGVQEDVDYLSVFKFLDICSGFIDINHFGTAAEQISIEQGSEQATTEYGNNVSIINLFGGGLSNAGRVFIDENLSSADANHITPDSNPQTYYESVDRTFNMKNNDAFYPAAGADINKVYTGTYNDWFAIEMISDIGTVDNADGTTDLYVYDKDGNIKGHYFATGIPKLGFFDHYYNKVTLGGNRRMGASSSNLDGRYWIDDFIIDDSRIGPTYFNAYQSSSDVIAPSSPSGLSVE